MRKIQCVKGIVFLFICAALFSAVSSILINGGDWAFQSIHGFYQQRENSVDAVYIGSSSVQKFWEAPLAWNQYGMTVLPFASSSQPLEAAEYLIREARKTQPDALYIVNINGVYEEITAAHIHHIVDFMPYSTIKRQIIEHLSEEAGISKEERAEFYFPFLRYHSSWTNILNSGTRTSIFQNLTLNRLKVACVYPYFLRGSKDVSLRQDIENTYTEETDTLPSSVAKALENLMVYCDAEQINILFVASPAAKSETFSSQLRTIQMMVLSCGFPVLNMMEYTDEIGLDTTTDYYDEDHTNIHGAVKTTAYLAKYLDQYYDFPDRREDPEYQDWDAAYEKYVRVISPWTLPFEYEDTEWDFSLTAPKMLLSHGLLSWEAVKGANGYGIFRKTGESAWELLTTVDAEQLSWHDADSRISEKSFYTVAAYSENEHGRRWGRCDIAVLSRSS